MDDWPRVLFQSTLPLRGATYNDDWGVWETDISIHAPLTGSDYSSTSMISGLKLFQSTLPLRGATVTMSTAPSASDYFNPRSPYGERQPALSTLFSPYQFQSTLPLRGATFRPASFHIRRQNFNPRSPYGERLHRPMMPNGDKEFQSTLPLRGATKIAIPISKPRKISIHAPLTGSDRCITDSVCTHRYFNPRSPYGERRSRQWIFAFVVRFQSTLPLRGATTSPKLVISADIFQSTLPLRGATHKSSFTTTLLAISIHAPLTGSDRRPGRS